MYAFFSVQSWWTLRIFYIFFLLREGGKGESEAPGEGGEGGRFFCLIENPRNGGGFPGGGGGFQEGCLERIVLWRSVGRGKHWTGPTCQKAGPEANSWFWLLWDYFFPYLATSCLVFRVSKFLACPL